MKKLFYIKGRYKNGKAEIITSENSHHLARERRSELLIEFGKNWRFWIVTR